MRTIRILLIIMLAAGLASCGRAPVRTGALPVHQTALQQSGAGLRQDTYHVIGPGETLWRIAKTYDVDANSIIRANRISDPSRLNMGGRLLIPQAAPIRPVVSLYPGNKWKHIIIHHSATDEGNALGIYKAHLGRGWDTIGYHFVIDNGSEGKLDGQIETGPRWTKQADGAHCKAGGMNSTGIGICLVGNFNIDNVSPKQMDSLVYLVSTLSRNYGIPASRIIGHGQVAGAKTDCPGKRFPWKEFYNNLYRYCQN